MTKKEYNGWYNYETWLVNLWITNDSGSDSYWRSTAQEAYDRADGDSCFTKEENSALDLAKVLEEQIEEESPTTGMADLYADLLNAALSEVNWHEIAEHFIEDCKKEETESTPTQTT